MRKFLSILLSLLIASPVLANDVYVAQSAVGGGTGVDCADAVAASYFNNAANWSATPTGIQIGPGTTVHLCGTFTGGTNTTMLTTQGNGTSGNPVTLHAESSPAALFTSPAWGTSGAISIPNNWIVADGAGVGIIENSANGTSGNTACLSGSCTVQQASTAGILAIGSNVTIKNWTVTHMCMHTENTADVGFFRGSCVNIQIDGANTLVTNNTLDNAATGVGGGNNNQEISFNTQTFNSRFVVMGNSSTTTYTGILVHNNDWSQAYIWDSSDNGYHADGVHFETSTGTGIKGFSNAHVYHNYSHGVWSRNSPGHITTNGVFINDAGVTNNISTIYNVRNIYELDQTNTPLCGGTCTYNTPPDGFSTMGACTLSSCTPPSAALMANNTLVGAGNCYKILDASDAPIALGNLCATTAGGNLQGSANGYPSANINYNLYPGTGTVNAFSVPAGNVNSWANWHVTPYFLDVNCNPGSVPPGSGTNCNPTLASAQLSASFTLGVGSTAIGASVNLTSTYCGTVPELCIGAPSSFGVGSTDNGVTASASGNWDQGAKPFSGATPTDAGFNVIMASRLPDIDEELLVMFY